MGFPRLSPLFFFSPLPPYLAPSPFLSCNQENPKSVRNKMDKSCSSTGGRTHSCAVPSGSSQTTLLLTRPRDAQVLLPVTACQELFTVIPGSWGQSTPNFSVSEALQTSEQQKPRYYDLNTTGTAKIMYLFWKPVPFSSF